MIGCDNENCENEWVSCGTRVSLLWDRRGHSLTMGLVAVPPGLCGIEGSTKRGQEMVLSGLRPKVSAPIQASKGVVTSVYLSGSLMVVVARVRLCPGSATGTSINTLCILASRDPSPANSTSQPCSCTPHSNSLCPKARPSIPSLSTHIPSSTKLFSIN